jgi:hypothetical protein
MLLFLPRCNFVDADEGRGEERGAAFPDRHREWEMQRQGTFQCHQILLILSSWFLAAAPAAALYFCCFLML